MKQFQVPQFITIEDKVIGPFTIKQFLYLASGTGILIFGFYVLQPLLFFIVAGLVGTIAGSLAFLKINDQPFPIIIKNAILYMIRPRLYIWRQEEPKRKEKKGIVPKTEPIIKSIPKLSESKLTDLAWSLDIQERLRE